VLSCLASLMTHTYVRCCLSYAADYFAKVIPRNAFLAKYVELSLGRVGVEVIWHAQEATVSKMMLACSLHAIVDLCFALHEDALALAQGKVAKWWVPDDCVLVKEIPHTATGKISKLELRKQFKDYRPQRARL